MRAAFVVEQNVVGIEGRYAIVSLFRNTHDAPAIAPINVIHKTGSTQHISTPPEHDQATVTCNTYGKFDEVPPCGF